MISVFICNTIQIILLCISVSTMTKYIAGAIKHVRLMDQMYKRKDSWLQN